MNSSRSVANNKDAANAKTTIITSVKLFKTLKLIDVMIVIAVSKELRPKF